MLQATKDAFIEIIEKNILPIEGGYVNNPNDAGGPTMWGITQSVARKNGYSGPMEYLPKDVATSIYIQEYIVAPHYDKVFDVSPKIAAKMIEAGVNVRYLEPAKWLQRLLNVSNQEQKMYQDLTVDGIIGVKTTNALATLLHYRGRDNGEKFILACLNHLQGVYYIERCEAREQNEAFFYGWIMNRTLM